MPREPRVPDSLSICTPTATGRQDRSLKAGIMNQATTRKVELFDTSLRDGMQQPNLEISVPNAIALLHRMSAFGVRYAEIGFAGANQFVSELTPALEGFNAGAMKLALFGRTRAPGSRVEDWPDVQFM